MESVFLLSGSFFVMLLIVWRMLVGSAAEQRQERMFADKVSGSGLGHAGLANTDEYTAVQLRICARPCQSALQMHGQSFLHEDAPTLPLAGCDRTCLCALEEIDDRRARNDRRLPDTDIVTFAEDDKVDNSRGGRDRRRRTLNPYLELN